MNIGLIGCVAAAVLSVVLAASDRAAANVIIFQDRTVFLQALSADPSLKTTVEGWDTYQPGTVFPNGSTVNGITYNVSAGDAIVVNTGVSLSPPNNLFQTAGFGFHPLVDTFTFGFPQAITVFGITFSSTFATDNGSYLLTSNNGDVVPSFFDPLFPGSPIGQFAGFISDAPFNTVVVSSTVNALYGMDDLIYARSVATPEPPTLWLLLSALSGLLLMVVARKSAPGGKPSMTKRAQQDL
jgi:hypothetical protein